MHARANEHVRGVCTKLEYFLSLWLSLVPSHLFLIASGSKSQVKSSPIHHLHGLDHLAKRQSCFIKFFTPSGAHCQSSLAARYGTSSNPPKSSNQSYMKPFSKPG
eukprot:6474712-Amphidinium_carterae.1